MTQPSLTGRGPRRRTRRSVRVAERVAKTMITIGGVGTILAVSLIMAFLLWVVVPLFTQSDAQARAAAPQTASTPTSHVVVDEYLVLAATVDHAGWVRVWRLDNGALLKEERPFGDAQPTCSGTRAGEVAFGFADGSVRLLKLAFQSDFLNAKERPSALTALGGELLTVIDGAVVQRTADDQLRRQRLVIAASEPLALGSAPVAAVDVGGDDERMLVAAAFADGGLALGEVEQSENPFTGETTNTTTLHKVAWQAGARGAPWKLMVTGARDRVFLVWADGTALRFDTRDPAAAKATENLDLVDGDRRVTALEWLVGRNTLLVGDDRGTVEAWFGVKPEGAQPTSDGLVFVRAHTYAGPDAAVTALAASDRNRSFVVGHANGVVRVEYATSGKLVAEAQALSAAPLTAVALGPKDDAIVAVDAQRVSTWSMSIGHPEATLAALFAPVWYEGYLKPEHTWQSSSGSDDFEPKFGLVPLVFGTLKATFYSMLFGVPLALLAAIFTSEFLSPRLRAPLKSLTEMMASLPSVVLGFIAALIIAPVAQDVLPGMLAMFVAVPFALLLGAYGWQLLPVNYAVRWSGAPRFAAIAITVPLGVLLAFAIGGPLEQLLFGGDVKQWLSGGGSGGAWGGWAVLMLPLSVLIVAYMAVRHLAPYLRRRSAGWTRTRMAHVDLCKFLVGGAIAVLLAVVMGFGLEGAGFDPRGGVLDTYVQRNALIVGFVMGFAVIPIVYTLAEDALSSVPAHLRLASLGAGATEWQTAVRVVIPTAMSGLFSALMIGLGRAVGETMIVLMATGNTPVMSWNVFNGFRTLSANIAVELPEAVRDSTHYRTLFLAGLCLFAMTFALNTVAELVRQRFRKRAYQL